MLHKLMDAIKFNNKKKLYLYCCNLMNEFFHLNVKKKKLEVNHLSISINLLISIGLFGIQCKSFHNVRKDIQKNDFFFLRMYLWR